MPLHNNLDLIQTTSMTQTEKMVFSENLIINIASSLFFLEITCIRIKYDLLYIYYILRVAPSLLHNYFFGSSVKNVFTNKYF